MDNTPPPIPPAVPAGSQYFQVPVLKLILMSICTGGLYELYWFYRNWRFIRDRDDNRCSPFWRSVFAPIWYFSLLRDISEHRKSGKSSQAGRNILLGVSFFALSAAWRLPDPYWLVSYFSFLTLLPALWAIHRINTPQAMPKKNASHGVGNFAAYLIGGPIMAIMILSTIHFLPGTVVAEGSQLWNKDITFLKEQGLLSEDDTILYFYSAGFLSIQDDGQFISEDSVVSYYRNPEDGVLYASNLPYREIEDIDVTWAESTWGNTIVTVTGTDGLPFELWMSSEAEGDRAFVDKLKSLWREAKRGEAY